MSIKITNIVVSLLVGYAALASSQTLINQGSYDSKSLVDTNSTSNGILHSRQRFYLHLQNPAPACSPDRLHQNPAPGKFGLNHNSICGY